MDTPRRKHRRYSDADQAEALAALDANGGNVVATARATGIPRTTIQAWKDGSIHPPPAELRQQKKLALADSLDRLAKKMFAQAQRKVKDMSGRDAVIAGAVLLDKSAMLRGETGKGAVEANVTVNVNPPSLTLTPADIEAAKELLAGVRQLPTARGSVTETSPALPEPTTPAPPNPSTDATPGVSDR